MNISEKYPQFEDEKALLIITGKQDAEFYLAHKGVLEKIEGFEIPRIAYSDNEGFMKKGRLGMFMGAGYVREDKKRAMRYKFLNLLESYLKDVTKKHSPASVYLFCPAYVMQAVKAIIPYPLKEQPIKSFTGDYHKQHPFKILEKIQKQKQSKPVPVMKEAARKILEKTKQARRVIGKKGRRK